MAQVQLPPGATLVDDQKDVALPPGAVLASDTAPAPSTEPKTPGLFKRLGQGVGIPTSKAEAEAMKPSTADIVLGPAAIAGKAVYNYGKNLFREGGKLVKETTDAATNVKEGGPVGSNVGKVGAAGSEFILKGLLAPLGGGSIQAWGEDIHAGNLRGAAGDALAVLTNGLLLKGSMKPGENVRANKISFAADLPESMDAPKQVTSVLPDLDKASPGNPPKTVGDLVQTVKRAKDNINNEVGQAIFPIRGKTTVPIGISQRIRSHVTPDMRLTPQGRAMRQQLLREALNYQKLWTYEQLNAARVNGNARLRAFFNKPSTAQYGDMKTQVDTIVDKEVTQGVQDIVYPEMDKAAGKPAGYFSNLLNRQSTLIRMGQAVDENAKALATRTAKIQGSPRFSSENVSAYGHPASTPGISIHKLQNVIVRPNPLNQANAAVNRSFSGRPVPTAAIYSLPVRELLIQNDDEKQPVKTPAEARQALAPQ